MKEISLICNNNEKKVQSLYNFFSEKVVKYNISMIKI